MSFTLCGLSQHVSKTQDPRCRAALGTSRGEAASSYIQQTTTPQPLNSNDTVSISNLKDGEDSGPAYDADGVSIEQPDPADLADADALQDLVGTTDTSTHDQPMAADESLSDPTPQHDQSEVGEADAVVSDSEIAVEVERFLFGMPGAPIPGRAQDPSAFETQATNMGSPWAPFQSQLEWDVARWAKLRGGTSTAVSELLAIPGVCASNIQYSVSNLIAIGR